MRNRLQGGRFAISDKYTDGTRMITTVDSIRQMIDCIWHDLSVTLKNVLDFDHAYCPSAPPTLLP